MLFISYNCGKLDGGFLTPGSYPKIDMGIFNGQREGNVVDLKKIISNNNNLIQT